MLIIGDVHGKREEYLRLIKDAEFSVQLGDLGFKETYDALTLTGQWSADKHIFIPGNHDDYDHLPVNALPAYGMIKHGGFEFFYLRGARSIDSSLRTEGVDWWRDEELSYHALQQAIDVYESARPRIVLTHTAPLPVIDYLLGAGAIQYKSATEQALTHMFEQHQPMLWLFGHFHQSITLKVRGTNFVCLNELESVELPSFLS